MAEEKTTKLSIIVRTVDQATAKIKAINDRLDATTKPIRDFKSALGDLRGKSGLDDVIGGFKGIGSAIGELLSKVALVGGIAGLATAGLVHLVDEFADLGKKAERLGVGVDFLAEMRYAAEKTGVPIEALDEGLQAFSSSLGQARAGVGRMAKFVGTVSPVLLQQLKAAKGNAEAFDILANAMTKITDPAKRAALAQKTLGDAALAPLFMKGAKGIAELRNRYLGLAGSQEGAAKSAGEAHESLVDLKATTDGLKAAIVEGLSPAISVLVQQLSEWFAGHRADIKEWAADIGDKLPGAVHSVIDAISGAIDVIRPFVDSGTKLKIALAAVAAVMAGPLISAIATLGIAMATTPIGQLLAALGLLAAAAGLIIKNWDDISEFFEMLWDDITGVFEAAWQKISAIVEKIKGAVTWVKDKLDFVLASSLAEQGLDALKQQEKEEGPGGGGNVVDKALSSLRVQQLAAPTAQAAIKVDFANMPKGARVSTAPGSTADVDLNVGYATGWMP